MQPLHVIQVVIVHLWFRRVALDRLDALLAALGLAPPLVTKPWGAWQTFVDQNREARAQLERKRAHL